MFDIGFSELLVIGIVALVVIGPERLPRVARTAGHLFGRFQRYVAGVKADIAREMELDELRKFKSEIESAARSMESTIQGQFSVVEQELNLIKDEAKRTGDSIVSLPSAEESSGTSRNEPNVPPPAQLSQTELALNPDSLPKQSDR